MHAQPDMPVWSGSQHRADRSTAGPDVGEPIHRLCCATERGGCEEALCIKPGPLS